MTIAWRSRSCPTTSTSNTPNAKSPQTILALTDYKSAAFLHLTRIIRNGPARLTRFDVAGAHGAASFGTAAFLERWLSCRLRVPTFLCNLLKPKPHGGFHSVLWRHGRPVIERKEPSVSNLLSLVRRVSNLLRLSDHFYFAERRSRLEGTYRSV
jgi:hypothetical protein